MTSVEHNIRVSKQFLKEQGFVVLTAKSYRAAQERQRMAQARAEWDALANKGTQRWAQEELVPEIRRLSDRVTFLYGAARAAGCTVEELRG